MENENKRENSVENKINGNNSIGNSDNGSMAGNVRTEGNQIADDKRQLTNTESITKPSEADAILKEDSNYKESENTNLNKGKTEERIAQEMQDKRRTIDMTQPNNSVEDERVSGEKESRKKKNSIDKNRQNEGNLIRKHINRLPSENFSYWKERTGLRNWENDKDFSDSLTANEDLTKQIDSMIENVLENAGETLATITYHNRYNSKIYPSEETEEEFNKTFEKYLEPNSSIGEPKLFSFPNKIKSVDHFNIKKLEASKFLSIKLKPGLYSVLLTGTEFKDIEGTLLRLCEEDPRIFFLVEYCMLHLDESKAIIIDYLTEMHSGINIARIKNPVIMFSSFKTFLSSRTLPNYSEYKDILDLDSWTLNKEVFDFVFSCLIVLMWRSKISFEVSIKEHFIFERSSLYGMPVEDIDFFIKSAWVMRESKVMFQLFKQLSFDDFSSNDRFLVDDTFNIKMEKFFRSFASLRSQTKTVTGDCILVSILLLAKSADLPIINSEIKNSDLLRMPELEALGDIYQMWLPMWEDKSFLNVYLDHDYSYHSIKNAIEKIYDLTFSENPLFEVRSIKDFKNEFDIILTRNKTGKATGLEVKKAESRVEKYQQLSYSNIAGRTIFSAAEPDILSDYVSGVYERCSALGFKNLLEIREFTCDFEKDLGYLIIDSSLSTNEEKTFSMCREILAISILGESYISFPEGYSQFCKEFLMGVIKESGNKDSEEVRDIINKITHTTDIDNISVCYRINTEGPFLEGIETSVLRDEMWIEDPWVAVISYLNRTLKPGPLSYMMGEAKKSNCVALDLKGGTSLHLSNRFLTGKRIGEKRKYKIKFYGTERYLKISIPYFLGWKYIVKQTYLFDRDRIASQTKVNSWIKLYEELQDRKLEQLGLNQSSNFTKMVELKRARKRYSKLVELFIDSFTDRIVKSVNLRILSNLDKKIEVTQLLNNPLFKIANENLVELFCIMLINNEFEIIHESTLIDWVEAILKSDTIYNVTVA